MESRRFFLRKKIFEDFKGKKTDIGLEDVYPYLLKGSQTVFEPEDALNFKIKKEALIPLWISESKNPLLPFYNPSFENNAFKCGVLISDQECEKSFLVTKEGSIFYKNLYLDFYLKEKDKTLIPRLFPQGKRIHNFNLKTICFKNTFNLDDVLLDNIIFKKKIQNSIYLVSHYFLKNTSGAVLNLRFVLTLSLMGQDGLFPINRLFVSKEDMVYINSEPLVYLNEKPSSILIFDILENKTFELKREVDFKSKNSLNGAYFFFDRMLEKNGELNFSFYYPLKVKEEFDFDFLQRQDPVILLKELEIEKEKEEKGPVAFDFSIEEFNSLFSIQSIYLISFYKSFIKDFKENPSFDYYLEAICFTKSLDYLGEFSKSEEILKNLKEKISVRIGYFDSSVLFSFLFLAQAFFNHIKLFYDAGFVKSFIPFLKEGIRWLNSIDLREPYINPFFSDLEKSHTFHLFIIGKLIDNYLEAFEKQEDFYFLDLLMDLHHKVFKDLSSKLRGTTEDIFSTLLYVYPFSIRSISKDDYEKATKYLKESFSYKGFILNPFKGMLLDILLTFAMLEGGLFYSQDILKDFEDILNYLPDYKTFPDFLNPCTLKGSRKRAHSIIATSEILNILRNLILLEKEKSLIIFPPPSLLLKTDKIYLSGIPTNFGNLFLDFKKSEDAINFSIRIDFLKLLSHIELNLPFKIKEVSLEQGVMKYFGENLLYFEPSNVIKGKIKI